MLQALYPCGKHLQYALDRRLGGFRIQSGCGGKEKKSLLGIELWLSAP
jgi:hypothetical protein